MLIKAGVDISRLNREIRRSMPKVAGVLYAYGEEFVITSTYEGTHGEGSLHYTDDAYDCRKAKRQAIKCRNEIREQIGVNYDVVSEADHLHIEWDPKS